MNAYDGLPESVTDVFGAEATALRAYDLLTVDVPAGSWIAALEIARDKLGCTYFDWLSAVDEPGVGFRVCAHVAALEGGAVRRLLVRTTVSHESPVLPTAVPVYAGAEWHERETHEMFGVAFTDHPNLVPLLLPENFEGHPLRKDFVLAARVAKAWPGAKEPGESDHGGPKRRQMLPPGVPDPNDWGPMKGQLPPAPARPARTPRAAGAAGAGAGAGRAAGAAGAAGAAAGAGSAAERPARRARTAAAGSASQAPGTGAPQPPAVDKDAVTPPSTGADAGTSPSTGTDAGTSPSAAADAGTPPTAATDAGTPPTTAARPPRRSRSASDGSASQAPGAEADSAPETPAPARPPRRSRSASDGSASQAGTPAEPAPPSRTRSSDAPWHHARPAFEDEDAPEAPEAEATPKRPETPTAPERSEADAGTAPEPDADQRPDRADPAPSDPAPSDPAPADPDSDPDANPADPAANPHPSGGDPA
ncbi:NADH-quinone oxidoreductase subunit C [Streptomyces sp. NPDC090127]|uniref:NADH-quinone oxidoreductase subunit C n=1 Tax=Streptomyces sp. NPDC090127 TaxID=3365953 RepID=UPI0037FE6E3D